MRCAPARAQPQAAMWAPPGLLPWLLPGWSHPRGAQESCDIWPGKDLDWRSECFRIPGYTPFSFSLLVFCLSISLCVFLPSPPLFMDKLFGFTSINRKHMWRSSGMVLLTLKRVWTMRYLSCMFYFLFLVFISTSVRNAGIVVRDIGSEF